MKQEIRVKDISLSFWGLLDGKSPDEVKTELDHITNDNISYIRQGCTLRFDVSHYGEDIELSLLITRQETDKEYAERNSEVQRLKEQYKENRRKEYLKLKTEFEGGNNGA